MCGSRVCACGVWCREVWSEEEGLEKRGGVENQRLLIRLLVLRILSPPSQLGRVTSPRRILFRYKNESQWHQQ